MDIGTMYTVRAKIAILAVRHFLGLGNHTDDVHAETVDALVAPPRHHIKYFPAHFGIIPVEIWLLPGKQVQLIHSCLFVILPCRPAKTGPPVVRRRLRIFALTPDIIIAVCIIP